MPALPLVQLPANLMAIIMIASNTQAPVVQTAPRVWFSKEMASRDVLYLDVKRSNHRKQCLSVGCDPGDEGVGLGILASKQKSTGFVIVDAETGLSRNHTKCLMDRRGATRGISTRR